MKKTINELVRLKQLGQKIAVLTCYDYPTALCLDDAGIDVALVGDSLGTNVLGYENEQQVTLDDIVHHLSAVRRGIEHAFIVADLPYRAYESPEQALANAGILIKAGADAVKLEGPKYDEIRYLKQNGIQVWAHLGLTPQTDQEKKVKAKTGEEAIRLAQEALTIEENGASCLVLELVPGRIAGLITQQLDIPTIGIGAGPYTDGQVLVTPDLLGWGERRFKHTAVYADARNQTLNAFKRYREEVLTGHFPAEKNAFSVSDEVYHELESWLRRHYSDTQHALELST